MSEITDDYFICAKPGCKENTHIELKCKCGKTGWSTKNIGFIGNRSIFYFGKETECSCPVSSLYHECPIPEVKE